MNERRKIKRTYQEAKTNYETSTRNLTRTRHYIDNMEAEVVEIRAEIEETSNTDPRTLERIQRIEQELRQLELDYQEARLIHVENARLFEFAKQQYQEKFGDEL